ncbi:mucin-2 [Folsomia candida]|nr:mucin-2 [Folsomia candida]
MKICTLFAILTLFVSSEANFGFGGNDQADGNLHLNHRRCNTVGTTVVLTRPDGSSESCVCQAPPTTTTTPGPSSTASTPSTAATTPRRTFRPRPTHPPPPPRNTWVCTNTPRRTTTPAPTIIPTTQAVG